MVIGVETKLKEKKEWGKVWTGEWRRTLRTYPEETFSAADAIVRRDAARRSFINANNNGKTLCARSHDRFHDPLPSPRRADRSGAHWRTPAGYVYTCVRMLIIKADIPHGEE